MLTVSRLLGPLVIWQIQWVGSREREPTPLCVLSEKPDSRPSSKLTFSFVAEKSQASVTACTEILGDAITGMGIGE